MMKQPTEFTGAWPVLLTPFTEQGDIDWPVYEAMLHWYIERGIGGLFACCLSSEMFHLTPEEREQLAGVAVTVASGRVPVVATGNFGPDERSHVDSAKRMADTGVDAVVLLVPTFARSDDELLRYYDAMVAGTDSPLGLYECPVPEHRLLPSPVVRELALTGRFVCYKETSCDEARLTEQVSVTRGTPLAILQANAPLLLFARQLGCPGSMCVSANVVPELVRRVLTEAEGEAVADHRRLCSIEALIRLGHPLSSKFLLAERGLLIEQTSRVPRSPLAPETQRLLCAAWEHLWSETPTTSTSP
jgi:4-hydroxy-tetrahydrodipicolinate synthase